MSAPTHTPHAYQRRFGIEAYSEAFTLVLANLLPLAAFALIGLLIEYTISNVAQMPVIGAMIAAPSASAGNVTTVIASGAAMSLQYFARTFIIVGLAALCVRILKNSKPDVADGFRAFPDGFRAILGVMAPAIVVLPLSALSGLTLLPVIERVQGAADPSQIFSAIAPAFLTLGGLAFVSVLVMGAVATVCLFAPFAAFVERRGNWESITRSWQLVKPQFGTALVFVIFNGLLTTAGLILCCIGYFVTFPVTIMATLLAFRDVTGTTFHPEGWAAPTPYPREAGIDLPAFTDPAANPDAPQNPNPPKAP